MSIIDASNLDVAKLSIDDIDLLISRLSDSITEEKKKLPLDEVVNTNFSEIWKSEKEERTRQFEKELSRQKDAFVLKTSMKLIVQEALGEENSRLFFNLYKRCIERETFQCFSSFYKKVEDSEVNRVAKFLLTVYRYNLTKTMNKEFIGTQDRLRKDLVAAMKDSTESIQAVISLFAGLDLLPS